MREGWVGRVMGKRGKEREREREERERERDER